MEKKSQGADRIRESEEMNQHELLSKSNDNLERKREEKKMKSK